MIQSLKPRPAGTAAKVDEETEIAVKPKTLMTMLWLAGLAGFSVAGVYILLHLHVNSEGHPGIVKEVKTFREQYVADQTADRKEREAMRLTLERLNTTIAIKLQLREDGDWHHVENASAGP